MTAFKKGQVVTSKECLDGGSWREDLWLLIDYEYDLPKTREEKWRVYSLNQSLIRSCYFNPKLDVALCRLKQ